VQRAPGIPHALCFQGENANLGRIAPRDREGMFSRHCEPSEAIHSFFMWRDGLLPLCGEMNCFASLAMTLLAILKIEVM
jgi:hypothetical protein